MGPAVWLLLLLASSAWGSDEALSPSPSLLGRGGRLGLLGHFGRRLPPPPSQPPSLCADLCQTEDLSNPGMYIDRTNNGICEDGGTDSVADLCGKPGIPDSGLGVDCSDCGPRYAVPPPLPPPPPPPLPSTPPPLSPPLAPPSIPPPATPPSTPPREPPSMPPATPPDCASVHASREAGDSSRSPRTRCSSLSHAECSQSYALNRHGHMILCELLTEPFNRCTDGEVIACSPPSPPPALPPTPPSRPERIEHKKLALTLLVAGLLRARPNATDLSELLNAYNASLHRPRFQPEPPPAPPQHLVLYAKKPCSDFGSG